MSRAASLGRFVIAWGTVALFLVFGGAWLADLSSPLKAGALFLTLAIVIIEVALIAAVMLGAREVPTLGRDTMFAVLMIVLNGVVGLALLLGGLRHHQQEYNLLPNFTRSTADSTLTGPQAFFFAVFTALLYGVFLGVQTVRHRHFFVEPGVAAAPDTVGPAVSARAVTRHAVLLVVYIVLIFSP